MSATFILLHLAGYVALLLWGMHMVHTGIIRAFGGHLRQALAIGLTAVLLLTRVSTPHLADITTVRAVDWARSAPLGLSGNGRRGRT